MNLFHPLPDDLHEGSILVVDIKNNNLIICNYSGLPLQKTRDKTEC